MAIGYGNHTLILTLLILLMRMILSYYADAGCEFNINEQSLQRLKQYIELTQLSQYGILSFELRRFFEKRDIRNLILLTILQGR